MYINLVNRRTGEAKQIKFGSLPLLKIKRLGASAAASASHYFISLIAENSEEIDFISTHFANVALPDSLAKQAIWTGDIATFIILNYPLPEKDQS